MFQDSAYQLNRQESIELLVTLQGLDKIYGVIKDSSTGNYLEGARVSVLNYEAFSDENGWWELTEVFVAMTTVLRQRPLRAARTPIGISGLRWFIRFRNG